MMMRRAPTIGLVVPSTNTTNVREWADVLPPGIGLAVETVKLPPDLAPLGSDPAHDPALVGALHRLRERGAAVIAYGCTATSMTQPRSRAVEHLEALSGCAAVATAPALVAACRALGVRRIALGTPYGAALHAHEVAYLRAADLEVVRSRGLGYGEPDPASYAMICSIDASTVTALAASVDDPRAEAVMLSCTDLPTFPLLASLEERLGKPVIASNSATLWAALREIGAIGCLPELGSLFAN